MKKIVLFALLLLMSSWTIQAQWSLAPEAGMTAVKRTGYGEGRWEAGWKVGLGIEYLTKPGVIGIKSGLYYTQRGYELPTMVYAAEVEQGSVLNISNGDTRRHFLQLPLMITAQFDLAEDVRLKIGAGPYAALCISNSYSFWSSGYLPSVNGFDYYGGYDTYYGGYYGYGDGYGAHHNSYYNPFKDIRSFDWGISAFVGLEVKRFFVNAGYEVSLSKETKYDSIGARYHTVSLTAGYKF